MSHLWKKLPPRMRMWALIVGVLVVALALKYANLPTDNLPLSGNIRKLEKGLVRRRKQLRKLKAKKQDREKILTELRTQARPLWMVGGGKTAAVEVQTEFQRLARQAQVKIATVGAPRANKVLDLTHVREIEFAVRITASMQEISRLLAEVECSPHKFYWSSCTMRPDNKRTPQRVVLSGKIKALVLSKEATTFLAGDSEGHGTPREGSKRDG